MGWVQLIYYIIVVIISIALAPKPPQPKPAALEDFDVPVAEEDRPIPVVFGEVQITGPNVLWFGDLIVKKIKKSGLFGSSTIGFMYHLGMHFGLCHGPIDAFLGIKVGEKEAFTGNVTASNLDNLIDKPSLFGGKKKEGGMFGYFDLMFGEDDQAPNSYLGSQTTQNPAYRGVVSVVWKRGTGARNFQTSRGPLAGLGTTGLIGNTPYLKPWAFLVRRILAGWENDDPFYPAKAVINTRSMNPAHIIYECITNSEWGMGESAASIDTTSFQDAADALFDEGFGLRLLWNRQDTIDSFIGIVLNHIAGALNFNRSTGKYELQLFRNDYEPEDLQEFDEDNIRQVTSFQRQLWGETSNELTIIYTDPDTLKEAPVVAHDLANIQAQGARINTKVSMTGVYDRNLAVKLAVRELVQRSTPLARMSFMVNRLAWQLVRGDVIKVSWARLGLSEVIFRVLNMPGTGTLKDGMINIECVEDIFGLPASVYIAPQEPEDPVVPPDPPDDVDDTDNANVINTALSTPPVSPADGDRYYVPLTPPATGAWAGLEGAVVEWDEATGIWLPAELTPGQIIYDETNGSHHQTDTGGDLIEVPWTLPGTTKGDILVFDGAAYQRLPVGTDGQQLTADSAAPLGVDWDESGGGGGGGSHYKIPLTNGDPDDPEMLFDSEGDIVTAIEETF